MKKTTLITAFALVAGLCASCVTDPLTECDPQERNIIFNFSVGDDFDPETRAATLYSTDAIQAIEVAKVYLFETKDNGASYKYVKTYDFDALWHKGWNSATMSLLRADAIPDGNYRFLAVGADNNTDYTMPAFTAGMDYSQVVATLAATVPQEIFSAYTDEVFDSNIESVAMIMTRRVSGVLLYVTNVPTSYTPPNGQPQTIGRLRLTISGTTKTLVINTDRPENTTPPNADQPGYDIFDIDLTAQGDANGDGFYDGRMVGSGVGQLPNTTLTGAYLMPAVYSNGATMVLKLMGADGVTIVRQWNVENVRGTATYPVRPNVIYSIGRKLQSANTNNGSDDPSDDDMPIDLSWSQRIMPIVVSGWGGTQQMLLEESN